jgi:ABC-type transport system involved in multi-copper enzyme maturation permease subunit
MAKRIGLGPVFAFEWLAVSRRWQWYAARSMFGAGLLAAMTVVWCSRMVNGPRHSVQVQAEFGRVFCGAVTAVQMAMVLLVAPAATAGSICLDRARGTLAHMLVTDLSSAEIVLGKLAARMVPVLAMLLCILPIPAMSSLLGGIDPQMVAGAMAVALGVAFTGCAAAMAFSTWGTKTHEVLLATYAGWALALLALPMCVGYRIVMGRGAPPPAWLYKANPVWLVAAPYARPGAVTFADQAAFLGASLLVSAGLMAVAACQLRRVAMRQGDTPGWDWRVFDPARILNRLLGMIPGPSLDNNPVLWREWHRRRPSGWARTVWSLYAAMTVALSTMLIVINLNASTARTEFASIGNGFQAGIGLLLLSVGAATALAEERVRGNLDILLVTPLSTRSIVWGKWWGVFRAVPLLAICPGVVAAALVRASGHWELAALMVGLYIAYGAAVTSLGLALSTWMHRIDLAVALNVAVLGGVTIGWLFGAMLIFPGLSAPGFAAASPIIGIAFAPLAVTPWEREMVLTWWSIWIAVFCAIAALLGWATARTFDRHLGRITDTAARSPRPREYKPDVVKAKTGDDELDLSAAPTSQPSPASQCTP